MSPDAFESIHAVASWDMVEKSQARGRSGREATYLSSSVVIDGFVEMYSTILSTPVTCLRSAILLWPNNTARGFDLSEFQFRWVGGYAYIVLVPELRPYGLVGVCKVLGCYRSVPLCGRHSGDLVRLKAFCKCTWWWSWKVGIQRRPIYASTDLISNVIGYRSVWSSGVEKQNPYTQSHDLLIDPRKRRRHAGSWIHPPKDFSTAIARLFPPGRKNWLNLLQWSVRSSDTLRNTASLWRILPCQLIVTLISFESSLGHVFRKSCFVSTSLISVSKSSNLNFPGVNIAASAR